MWEFKEGKNYVQCKTGNIFERGGCEDESWSMGGSSFYYYY